MSLVGMRAKNHPQQVAGQGATDGVDDRATVAEVFRPIDARFGGFTVDVAASAVNTKCARYYDRATDGLAQSWAGERVWCNPPYSAIAPWLAKAWAEITTGADLVVMLLPANRTEQGWWTDLVEPWRDRPGSPLRCEFLPGRIQFLRPGQASVRSSDRSPFGCCLLIFTPPPSGFVGPEPAPTLFDD